jgi:acyl-CoA thioester hydrolase
VVHPATLVVELYAGAVGRSSLVVEHRLSTLEDPHTCYGEGYCKLVWIDHSNNASVAVPDDVRQVMGA